MFQIVNSILKVWEWRDCKSIVRKQQSKGNKRRSNKKKKTVNWSCFEKRTHSFTLISWKLDTMNCQWEWKRIKSRNKISRVEIVNWVDKKSETSSLFKMVISKMRTLEITMRTGSCTRLMKNQTIRVSLMQSNNSSEMLILAGCSRQISIIWILGIPFISPLSSSKDHRYTSSLTL
jgi:hypothetical protein